MIWLTMLGNRLKMCFKDLKNKKVRLFFITLIILFEQSSQNKTCYKGKVCRNIKSVYIMISNKKVIAKLQ